MKRYIIPLSMAVMVLASCSVEESQSPVSDGRHIVLMGSSNTATKVSVGEKDGEGYPLLWFTGDAISINSKDATVAGAFVGESATLDANSSGSNTGNFRSVNELVPETDMELLILYPGNGMDYKTRIVTGSVAASQTQRSANSSIHLGNNCFAMAETSIKAGQTDGVNFSLNHKTAFVKVVVTASEDYKKYKLAGATLSADGAKLAGDLSYSVDDGELTVSNSSSSVGATISTTSALDSEQSVYFTALPCDLTDKEVTVTLSMFNESDESASLPVQIDGGELKENCLTVIHVTVGNVEAWYETDEPRDLMNAWAYGAQNTYLIEQKDSEDTSITFEVKARGDITKVKEPKYYGIICTGDVTTALVYLMNGSTKVSSVKSGSNNVVPIGEDYEITVYCIAGASSHWAVVGIYDEDYNILWSYMIWKYLEGDTPGDVKYTDFTVMDRVIGCPYSNKLAEEKGTFDQPAVAYFQWGRKDPFPWNNTTTIVSMYVIATSESGVGVESSILNPTTAYGSAGKTDDWKWSDNDAELWGGNGDGKTLSDSGHKTIYDPCPAGYRVPDRYVLTEVYDNDVHWEIDFQLDNNTKGLEGQDPDNINEDSPFYESHHAVSVYTFTDGTHDYWPYDGSFYGDNSKWDDRSSNSNMTSYMYWGCNQYPDKNSDARVYCLDSYTSSQSESTHQPKERRAPVRCQKDN